MELARQAGLHFTYISDVERGVRNIGFENLLVIADALDVGVAFLVDGLHHDAG